MSLGTVLKEQALTGAVRASSAMAPDLAGRNLDTTYIHIAPDGAAVQRMSVNAFIKAIKPLLGTLPGGDTVTLDAATYEEYKTAVQNAAVGGKRVAGANAIANALGTHRIKLFRDGADVATIDFTGSASVVNAGGIVALKTGNLGAITVAGTPDIHTGSWTFELQGGSGFTRKIAGTAGSTASGKQLILSDDPVAGMGLINSFTLVLPASLDA